MMFPIFALSLCVLAIIHAQYLDVLETIRVFQIGFFLLAGMVVFYSGKMKERSVMDVIYLWSGWVLLSDWASWFPPVGAITETAIFVVLLGWVYFRSYNYSPGPISSGNVYIAFYGGPNAPFLSRIASHVGFPFASIAISANELAVRPSKKTGTMVEVSPYVLEKKGYVFVDTGIHSSPEIIGKLKSVVGTSTGHRFLRVKCLQNLIPVLKCLGPEWVPKGWPAIPAWYYSQCIKIGQKQPRIDESSAGFQDLPYSDLL